MRSRYLIANWKMNLPPEGTAECLDAVAAMTPHGASIVVAPPFPFLKEAVARRAPHVAVGAQNCSDQRAGAVTGEVSAPMLADCGVQYVILGHSERRSLFLESDALIARKLAVVIDCGLRPVLCIGEDLRVREAGHVARFLADQLRETAIAQLSGEGEVIIAYEPVWAIGTGRNATGAMVAETVGEIRESLVRFWPAGAAERTSILYGGSVTPDNVADLEANATIDGYLVGGASLDSAKFLAIYRAMATT